MQKLFIAGAGKIGTLITCLLSQAQSYDITVADVRFDHQDIARLKQYFPKLNTVTLNFKDTEAVRSFFRTTPQNAIISCLPYYVNPEIAKIAREFNLHYFDLTEDTSVTSVVKELATGASSAFVPQCGLAPGFISIAANTLMKRFDQLETVRMRVGALPQFSCNGLYYALTWSTEGVINQYGNPCTTLLDGKMTSVLPLEGLETVQIDGIEYEAFNTSGGLGSLAELYQGKVKNMNYKTLRYPGHCNKIRFLMNELKLNEDRDTLKHILENAIPKSYEDVVVIYVSVLGQQHGQFMQETYVKKIYPQVIADIRWSAIQVTTAAGICAIVDKVLSNAGQFRGLVHQEQFALDDVLQNRFGKYYA